MKNFLGSFVIGLLFGLGLVVSMMVNPLKVLAFLDVAGAWDPSLLFVMGAALAVTFIGYRLVFKRTAPLWGAGFSLPTRRDVDQRLLIGASLFGIGWGLVGFCPGPAITALAVGGMEVVYFGLAMVFGMIVTRFIVHRRAQSASA
ncbi:transporter [Iodidimonas muriae]|uniref:Transporter n=1 Tax=Iodidimonas muriae TaxID=261467 RepID=A0ABQ2LDP0_9PROT|nr:DUF6691 family protein [Iodidimonas muriae]GGO11446.1 transporter [Iodidimonas muriae]